MSVSRKSNQSKKTKNGPYLNRIVQSNDAHLLNVSSEVHQSVLGPYLNNKDVCSLRQSCFFLYNTYQSDINRRAFVKLLQAVVDDDRPTVTRMLDAKPELLITECPKKLVIESTKTWQRFYAEKPLSMAIKRRQFEMAKLILPYFKVLEKCHVIEDGKKEALTQWAERLPNREYDFTDLINVILKENFQKGTEKDRLIDRISEETKNMLAAFRKEMLPDEATLLDNYFDVEQVLLASYQVYGVHFNVFQNSSQRSLFCIGVIGFIQGLVSPELAKVFCACLILVGVRENLKSLTLLWDNIPFYRSSVVSQSGQGFDFVTDDCGKPVHELRFPNYILRMYIKYIEQKQIDLTSLKEMDDIWPKKNNCSIQ